MKSNFTVYLADRFKCKVYYKCNPDIILRQDRLFLDIKGYWETAGRKWRGSLCPCGVCICGRESLENKEEKVCLSVSKEEGLPKSGPILDRRSSHPVALYQPHFTRLIYLPVPFHFLLSPLPPKFPFSSSVPNRSLLATLLAPRLFDCFSGRTVLKVVALRALSFAL